MGRFLIGRVILIIGEYPSMVFSMMKCKKDRKGHDAKQRTIQAIYYAAVQNTGFAHMDVNEKG